MADFRYTSTKAGRFLTIPTDVYIGKSIEVYGEWSFGEIELLSKLIAPGDNVVEVGSNIGAHTVFIARDLCVEGMLYAFEPRRVLFQLLCANLMLNGIDRVRAFQLALGDSEGVIHEGALPMTTPINAGAFGLGKVPGEGEEIAVVALDTMSERLKTIALLKADVEGHELSVLLGAGGIIERDRPVLYLENDRPDQSEALVRHVMELGYDLYWHIVPLFRPNNHAGTGVNIFGNTCSFNMLCLPSEKAATVSGLARIVDPTDHPLRREKPDAETSVTLGVEGPEARGKG